MTLLFKTNNYPGALAEE